MSELPHDRGPRSGRNAVTRGETERGRGALGLQSVLSVNALTRVVRADERDVVWALGRRARNLLVADVRRRYGYVSAAWQAALEDSFRAFVRVALSARVCARAPSLLTGRRTALRRLERRTESHDARATARVI